MVDTFRYSIAIDAARTGPNDRPHDDVVGSYAYNMTMTLGAGALARPLTLADARILHVPLVLMIGSLIMVALLAARHRQLGRPEGAILLAVYPIFVLTVLLA